LPVEDYRENFELIHYPTSSVSVPFWVVIFVTGFREGTTETAVAQDASYDEFDSSTSTS